ncbi:MAG: heme-copper oxidase subunit III [Planctomycetes bacterium]|nr:heme-copper oxidase subunit III [Planctomycetota bacterium]
MISRGGGGTIVEAPDFIPPDLIPPEDGDDGGGGDRGGGEPPPNPGDQLPITMTRMATIFVLAMVVMLFAGFASSFVILESGDPTKAGFVVPPQANHALILSTIVIALSSVAGFLASRALAHHQRSRMLVFMYATLALGMVFCMTQMIGWSALWSEGITPRSNNYSGNFYAITVLHAAHVLGGLIWVVITAMRARARALDSALREAWGNTMLYWHVVGVIWYALFAMLRL